MTRSHPAIYFIASAIALVVVTLAFLLPLHKEQQKLKTDMTESRVRLNDFSATMASLPDFVNRTADIVSAKRDLSEKLYTKGEVLTLLKHLYVDAEDHRLTVIEVTPPVSELLELNKRAVDSLQPLFLNLHLKIEGDYSDFGNFVDKIEQEELYRGTNSVQIIGSREDYHNLQYHLGFRVLLGVLEDVK